jgi:hypothetical protein
MKKSHRTATRVHRRHRRVVATVATATAWPPPSPPCTGHRRVLPTTATATRVPSPCHVSPPLPRASPRRHRRATCRSRFHVPRPAASPRHLSPPLPRATPRRFPAPPVAKLAASLCYKAPRARGTTRRRRLRSFVAGMPPRRRGSSGFRGVRARPNGRFYAEMRAGGFRLTLGTYNTPELAARAYDAPTTTLGGTTFGPRQPPTTSRSTRLVVYLFYCIFNKVVVADADDEKSFPPDYMWN